MIFLILVLVLAFILIPIEVTVVVLGLFGISLIVYGIVDFLWQLIDYAQGVKTRKH